MVRMGGDGSFLPPPESILDSMKSKGGETPDFADTISLAFSEMFAAVVIVMYGDEGPRQFMAYTAKDPETPQKIAISIDRALSSIAERVLVLMDDSGEATTERAREFMRKLVPTVMLACIRNMDESGFADHMKAQGKEARRG